MKVSIKPLWRVALPATAMAAGTAALVLGGASPNVAEAAEPCGEGIYSATAPTQDAQVFDVEGKITAYDTTTRTITVNGTRFHIPPTEKIKTQTLDQTTGNLELTGPGSLTDPAQSSIIGSSAIAGGTVNVTALAGGGHCITFAANSVYVEPAEHGIVGPLLSVDPAQGTYVVGGSTVKMNTDPRYPSTIVDLAGAPMTVADLQSQVGTLLDVVGYYDEAAGTLRGTVVEADVLMPQAGSDTVAVTRAQWKSQELRVRGTVSLRPDGSYAPTVSLHTGAGCTGIPLATTDIDPAGGGAFDFRVRTANPGTICLKSAGGGQKDTPVTAG